MNNDASCNCCLKINTKKRSYSIQKKSTTPICLPQIHIGKFHQRPHNTQIFNRSVCHKKDTPSKRMFSLFKRTPLNKGMLTDALKIKSYGPKPRKRNICMSVLESPKSKIAFINGTLALSFLGHK